jgi:hypothetical protein
MKPFLNKKKNLKIIEWKVETKAIICYNNVGVKTLSFKS